MADIADKIEKATKAYIAERKRTFVNLYDFSSETIGIIERAYRQGVYQGITLGRSEASKRNSVTRKKTTKKTSTKKTTKEAKK